MTSVRSHLRCDFFFFSSWTSALDFIWTIEYYPLWNSWSSVCSLDKEERGGGREAEGENTCRLHVIVQCIWIENLDLFLHPSRPWAFIRQQFYFLTIQLSSGQALWLHFGWLFGNMHGALSRKVINFSVSRYQVELIAFFSFIETIIHWRIVRPDICNNIKGS